MTKSTNLPMISKVTLLGFYFIENIFKNFLENLNSYRKFFGIFVGIYSAIPIWKLPAISLGIPSALLFENCFYNSLENFYTNSVRKLFLPFIWNLCGNSGNVPIINLEILSVIFCENSSCNFLWWRSSKYIRIFFGTLFNNPFRYLFGNFLMYTLIFFWELIYQIS